MNAWFQRHCATGSQLISYGSCNEQFSSSTYILLTNEFVSKVKKLGSHFLLRILIYGRFLWIRENDKFIKPFQEQLTVYMLILRIGSWKHSLEWKAYVCHGVTIFSCSMNYTILWIKNWKLNGSLDKLLSSKSSKKTPGKELGQGELYTGFWYSPVTC